MKIHPNIRPRRWQTRALEIWARDMHGVASVVTGGGKTVFAYLCIQAFLNRYSEGRVVIIVPTIALLDQWYVDIADSTDISEDEIACYSGENHPERPKKISILVLNTARLTAPDLSSFGDLPKMLVVDECHRTGSPQNSLALRGDYTASLGLSATPEREFDDGFREYIVPALGPIFYEYSYREARRDGVIVDFDLVNIQIESVPKSALLHTSAVKNIESILNKKPHVSDTSNRSELLQKRLALSSQTAIRVPWAVKLALAHQNQRIIIFHERVASLTRIIALLAKFGQNAVTYHSQLSEPHRRDNLRLFRRGMVNVLVTCRALDEGANVPEANVAIIARSTSSTRQRIQRLGRVLRPAIGKSAAIVYTLYSGKNERSQLEDEEQDLEGVARIVWKRGSVT